MRQRRLLTALVGAAVVAALVPGQGSAVAVQSAGATAPSSQRATATALATTRGPAFWSTRRLASQLVIAGVDMGNLDAARPWARDGIGGIVLFGNPPTDLAARLDRIRDARAVPPFVASDEEGGRVQRLTSRIYALPSAEWMGANRTPARVRAMSRAYGTRMRALGVDMDLGPVADLGVKGAWTEKLDRAFSARPWRVAAYANAWQRGMRAAHVAPVVKHWPGHGSAQDTHVGLASTPSLAVLQARDLVPFRAAFRAGVPAVMVGHLLVPGLTEPGTPASLSPRAMRLLRAQAGGEVLILTDSLAMGAIRSSLGLSVPQAAVRALRSGADMAMIDGVAPGRTIDAVAAAIRSGSYPRAQAVASARRILAVKATTAP